MKTRLMGEEEEMLGRKRLIKPLSDLQKMSMRGLEGRRMGR